MLRYGGNPHNSNAVVIFDQAYRQVGYLSRDVTSQMAPLIDQQLVDQIECEVIIAITGLDQKLKALSMLFKRVFQIHIADERQEFTNFRILIRNELVGTHFS